MAEEYTPYVQAVRNRKAAEIEQYSRKTKIKNGFRMIVNDYREKRAKAAERKIIEEPVAEPEVEEPEDIQYEIPETLEEPEEIKVKSFGKPSNISSGKKGLPKKQDIEPKSVSAARSYANKEFKDLKKQAYEEGYQRGKEKREKEQIQKAKERGEYYGSTTVIDRTKHRAEKVVKAAKPIAKAAGKAAQDIGAGIKPLADDARRTARHVAGNTNIPKPKKVKVKVNKRRSGAITKHDTLPVKQKSSLSTNKNSGSPAPLKKQSLPVTSRRSFVLSTKSNATPEAKKKPLSFGTPFRKKSQEKHKKNLNFEKPNFGMF